MKEKKKLKAARWTYLSTGLLRESAAMIKLGADSEEGIDGSESIRKSIGEVSFTS